MKFSKAAIAAGAAPPDDETRLKEAKLELQRCLEKNDSMVKAILKQESDLPENMAVNREALIQYSNDVAVAYAATSKAFESAITPVEKTKAEKTETYEAFVEASNTLDEILWTMPIYGKGPSRTVSTVAVSVCLFDNLLVNGVEFLVFVLSHVIVVSLLRTLS